MSNLASFCARYSQQTMQLPGGAEFSYRYYRNPVARATVVLLPGGIGLPDLFYLHFERFAEHYSVITFDYQEQFTMNAELARAVASLLDGLDKHVWLVGQSLAEENISADQISQVAGTIQEQGVNLDLGSIAEQAGLPADIIGQISGLLGK